MSPLTRISQFFLKMARALALAVARRKRVWRSRHARFRWLPNSDLKLEKQFHHNEKQTSRQSVFIRGSRFTIHRNLQNLESSWLCTMQGQLNSAHFRIHRPRPQIVPGLSSRNVRWSIVEFGCAASQPFVVGRLGLSG